MTLSSLFLTAKFEFVIISRHLVVKKGSQNSSVPKEFILFAKLLSIKTEPPREYGALNCNCFPVKPKRIWPVPEPHLLVVCYSAVDFESFREVEDTVVPEVTEAFPSAPVILVATKCDLKDNNSPTSSLHEEGRTI